MERRGLKKEKNKTKNSRQGVMKRVTGRNYFDGDTYKKSQHIQPTGYKLLLRSSHFELL
jgi:hypothetical protein